MQFPNAGSSLGRAIVESELRRLDRPALGDTRCDEIARALLSAVEHENRDIALLGAIVCAEGGPAASLRQLRRRLDEHGLCGSSLVLLLGIHPVRAVRDRTAIVREQGDDAAFDRSLRTIRHALAVYDGLYAA
jgi:hypothetical protein